MVYLYKKPIGDRDYYYLRASERKGDKVLVKDIAYLGSSIEEAKKALENLPHHAEKIRKAYKTIHQFIESNRYLEKVRSLKLKSDRFLNEKGHEIEACRLHYVTVFSTHDETTKYEILKNFIIEFAFNTASIEGNTIRLAEARNLLQEGITPKNKSVREIYDLQNTEKVLNWLLHETEEISHELIIKIHRELMEKMDNRTGYRTEDVRIIKANFKATPAPYVKIDMNALLKWYDKNKDILHPFVLAILFHHKFEKIHPFMDGNGRTGRMLLNYILLRHEYPPLIIHTAARKKYLTALQKADTITLPRIDKEKYQELLDFTSDEMIKTYWNIFL